MPQAYLPYADLSAPHEENPRWRICRRSRRRRCQPAVETARPRAASASPERSDIVDLYFVGFAGYDAQDVFMKEVAAARDLIETRFDARDARSRW